MSKTDYTKKAPAMRESTSALDCLRFDNVYAQLPQIFHSHHEISALAQPFLVDYNSQVADLLQLDRGNLDAQLLLDYCMGQQTWSGTEPLAMCYAGHQFGQYVPRLGDGRALLLGQIRDTDNRLWDLQLKGSGRTLYSRQGDGKAVLRSSVREYLCSAAMHGLGIPTTYALALIGSEEPVYREQLEPAAMILRVAESHLRFGSFEYFFYGNQTENLKKLGEFTLQNYFPYLYKTEQPYLRLLEQVIESTAKLIAKWQSVGFCHGVMNTDNMSIHGITLDYGPYGFLDTYQAEHICNHSDYSGRYAFNRQPRIGLFNLSCFAQAVLPLIDEQPKRAGELATEALEKYDTIFDQAYFELKCKKLGLADCQTGDAVLYDSLLSIMETEKMDFTRTFRDLSELDFIERLTGSAIACSTDRDKTMTSWLEQYQQRLKQQSLTLEQRSTAMKEANPKFVLRNYLAEMAIRQAQDEKQYDEIRNLTKALANPYQDSVKSDKYAVLPPQWAETLSVNCSS